MEHPLASHVDRPTAPEPILSFRGVTKRFGGTLAVHEIDLDFRQGEVHALLGANGAGKSTLIKLLAGVHEPDSGEIYLAGQRIDHVSRARRWRSSTRSSG